MKLIQILLIVVLAGSLFLVWQMDSIHRELAEKTVPRFDILRFEIPPTLEYSQDLFQSIESNGVSEEVRQSLRWDYLFIPTGIPHEKLTVNQC